METNDKTSKCQWRKCGEPSEIVYLGLGLCEKHWVKVCDMSTEEAHKKLGIKDEPKKEQ